MKTEKKQLIELPSFELNSHGIPEDNAIRAYDTDGIVCLRKVFEPSWIEMLEEGMEIAINMTVIELGWAPIYAYHHQP